MFMARYCKSRAPQVAAGEMPELRSRQLAAWIADNRRFSVSESTVYRILRREGLVKSPEMQLKAGFTPPHGVLFTPQAAKGALHVERLRTR